MIIYYNLDKEKKIEYYPVILNQFNIFHNVNIKSNASIGKETIDIIFNKINSSNAKIFIIDFLFAEYLPERLLINYKNIFQQEIKGIIFYNCIDDITLKIHADLSDYVNIHKNIIANDSGIEFYKPKGKEFIQKNLTMQLHDQIIKGSDQQQRKIFLDSSGIYANRYINIKQIFYDPKFYYLIFFFFLSSIINNYKTEDYDKLICSSYNGAALASIIGQMLNKDVVYLMNLGPRLTISDRELIKGIEPHKKYLYIADFICLGTEFKILKTTVRLQNSNIIGGVSVASYKCNPDYKIHPIVDITDKEYKIII